MIDHVSRTIACRTRLVLNVTERQPFATLAVADTRMAGRTFGCWTARASRSGTSTRPRPASRCWTGRTRSPPPSRLGRPLADDRVADAFALMVLVRDKKILDVRKIKVDQNAEFVLK